MNTQIKWAKGLYIPQISKDDIVNAIEQAYEDGILAERKKKWDYFIYEGKPYHVRVFSVKHDIFEGETVQRMIAPESLQDAILNKKGGLKDDAARKIDWQVYHFIPDSLLYNTTGKELCKKHLDIPMEFVEEEIFNTKI